MSLATEITKLTEKVNDFMDLVKGQYNKWDGEVKAKIAELESWRLGFIFNTYRMDFRASKQGGVLKIKATPYSGSVATVYDLVKLRNQADWSFNQIFIKIRRYSYSPTTETIYRLDHYYDSCTLTLEKDGGCNVLTLTDNGIVGASSSGKDINEWILSANMGAYIGLDIDMEFTTSLAVTDYRNPLSDSSRGSELLSNLKISE